MTRVALFALGLLVSMVTPGAAQLISKTVVDVGTGASAVRYILLTPFNKLQPRPIAAVMLFAGGNGRLAINAQGDVTTNLSGNFLVRTSEQFAQQYLYVAVVDTPGGVGINEATRHTPEYAAAMAAVIGDLRARTSVPKIWLVGTSSGTISASSIAALYYQQSIVPPVFPRPLPNTSRPNGVVLTSTQTNTGSTGGTTCSGTIFDKPTHLGNINVPVYVASDRNDTCPCTPPKRTQAVLDALTSAPVKQSQLFPLTGTSPTGPGTDVCTAFTPHGFWGIESSVVSTISNWVKSH